MFNWFTNIFKRNQSDTGTLLDDMKKAEDVTPIPPVPGIPKNQVQDHYRVGYDSVNGATTLTLHADYTSMTLSLGPEEVMRMIRMLGATLDDDIIAGGMMDDGEFPGEDD
jgi:hypothetical protein